ncbi:hypothetical protein BGZ83_011475 [Gryganskiella cystojenkinii]|nr:hypothetical protein BGZ83_011475 [Gryganskiella cystojenkinii]
MVMAEVTFNLVGLREKGTDEFGVLINDKLTKLTTTKENYPLWSANVAGIDAPLEYTFVQIDKAGKVEKMEKGARKLPTGAQHTPNDFFDRPNTLSNLPPLPQVYENKLRQDSPFFREGYIGNIFVEGDPAKIEYINKKSNDLHPNDVKVNFHYIGANDNVRINDVDFNLSGASAKEYAKLAYQFKFPGKNPFLDHATLKLRNEETDATMMREKLYVDILNSIGVPAQQASYVRLFFNGKPVGLYVAVEEMKEQWVKKVLHPEVKKVKTGALWKMNSCCGYEGNLQWLGPSTKSYVLEEIYKNILPGANPKDDVMQDLIKFMADLRDYDPKKVKNPVAYWQQRLDLDGFLKSMAMEYLTGSWDSYWGRGSNYQIYNDPGHGYPRISMKPLGKIDSYKNVPKVNHKGFESPLVQKLIVETPAINKKFEEILKEIVNYVFKPEAVSPRLEAYKKMIQADVAWDRSLQRWSTGKNQKFRIEDLSQGLQKGVNHELGLLNWVTKLSTQVQKDLGFKALEGNPTKVEYHVMTTLGSPYGLIANKQEAPAKQEAHAKPAVGQTPLAVGSISGNSRDTAITDESTKKFNSADILKCKRAALSSILAMIVLVL